MTQFTILSYAPFEKSPQETKLLYCRTQVSCLGNLSIFSVPDSAPFARCYNFYNFSVTFLNQINLYLVLTKRIGEGKISWYLLSSSVESAKVQSGRKWFSKISTRAYFDPLQFNP